MGDRTFCVLHYPTPLPDSVAAVLKDEWGVDDAEIQSGRLEFEEVNYGKLGQETQDAFKAAEHPYAWVWGVGYEFGPGAEVFDGKQLFYLDRDVDGNVVLTLRAASNPEYVKRVQHWADYLDKLMKETSMSEAD